MTIIFVVNWVILTIGIEGCLETFQILFRALLLNYDIKQRRKISMTDKINSTQR